jgi:hypothetical protein
MTSMSLYALVTWWWPKWRYTGYLWCRDGIHSQLCEYTCRMYYHNIKKNPIYITDTSKSRLKIHTQTSSLSTLEYLKVVSLDLYFTSSTLLIYQPPQTLPQPPLRMILLSWPLTPIRPLPPRNYKPASLLSSIGLPNGDWKLIALDPIISPLQLVEQHVPGSTSTTSNFPRQKKLSILGYTWTDTSPGISTSLPKGNILASHSPKCTGCLAISPNFP